MKEPLRKTVKLTARIRENENGVDLNLVPTDRLLDEIAKRKGIQEISLIHRLYRDDFDLIHLYHDDPKRHIIADRAFLLNPRYRQK